MRHAALCLVVAVGCLAEPELGDDRDDSFLTDGKADTGGVEEGSPDARAVLVLVNSASYELLHDGVPDGVGLSTLAAQALLDLRTGDDGEPGTGDEVRFTTLAELDGVPFIGPVAFERLVAYVRSHGLVIAIPDLTLPLTAEKLVDYLVENGVRTKAEALARLPRQLHQNFVLVTNTRGLGKSTRALPRPALFSMDARFLLTYSGHTSADDPTADVFEIIDVDPATDDWRMATITFAAGQAPQLDRDDDRCQRCHGAPARPIWGGYPEWPDAYGGSLSFDGVDRMTPEEHVEFDAFAAAAPASPDYRSLEIHSDARGFYLPDRYGLPNTTLSARLGVRHGAAIYHRLSSSPSWPALKSALMLVSQLPRCTVPSDIESEINRRYIAAFTTLGGYLRHRVYRLLGVTPRAEMRLDVAVEDAGNQMLDEDFRWNAGVDDPSTLMDFLALRDFLAEDDELRAQFASRLDRVDELDLLAYQADGDTLEQLTRNEPDRYLNLLFPSLHYTVFDILRAPVEGAAARKAEVCRIFSARARVQLGLPVGPS